MGSGGSLSGARLRRSAAPFRGGVRSSRSADGALDVTQHLQKLLAQADLPRIRFHDARGSFISWAADAGIDLDTVAALVGHSTTSVTRKVYLKVFEQKKADAVAKLDALFEATGS